MDEEFSEIRYDKIKDVYYFDEQLYPTSRGWICHEYPTKEKAELARYEKINS